MYWRGFDPTHHDHAYFSLAAVLMFAWLLAAIRAFDAGLVDYALLAIATLLVAAIALQRKSRRRG